MSIQIKKTKSKKKLSQDDYRLFVYLIRGTVINACISLEIMMDLYISEKFCLDNDKVNELSSFIVTPRITWSQKLEVIKLLIIVVRQKYKTAITF